LLAKIVAFSADTVKHVPLARILEADSATLAAWCTALITLFGILAAVCAVWWQIRKQGLMNSAGMITDLADQYTSEEWRSYRVHCAATIEALQRGEVVDLSKDFPVLGFFENIGHLVRRRILDKRMIWNKFGWYITRYYIALTYGSNLIEKNRMREGDSTLWEEFEWLNKRMLRVYRRRGIAINSKDMLRTRIEELVKQEAHLADSAESSPRPKLFLPGMR
jgi:hypothetical protein